MKYLLLLLFSVSFSFSQIANGESSVEKLKMKIIKPEKSVTYLSKDFNHDGRVEELKGEKIVQMDDNEYWVKNTKLTSQNGDVFTFNNKLKKNDSPIIRQVAADYGYILVFEPNSSDVAVYLAGENGSKDSDVLYISVK